MKRLFREPLLHFVLLGAVIFAVYGWLPGHSSPSSDKIVVTQGQIEHLALGFLKTWQRPPTAEELQGLIRDYVREEVCCREAIALGLDKDDTMIRRRLRQKMEFITDDLTAQTEPTDAELKAYLEAHPESFKIEPRLSFRHIFLNPQKHGGNLERDTAQLLAQLSRADPKADVSAMGDSLLLENDFPPTSLGDIARQFGTAFATKLAALPVGNWQGPVESGYGVHLVCIRERLESRVPELAEVRESVRREWSNARRLESNERYYQELLKRYVVTVEPARPPTTGTNIAKTQ